MAIPTKLKNLLKSAPNTAGLAKYLNDLDNDIYNNSTSDAALAARVTSAENAITPLTNRVTAAEGLIQALAALHTHDIEFTVKDDEDTPAAVEGATVTIASKTGTTVDTGKCTIEDILEGTYSAVITADGFDEKTQSITVTAETTSFNVTLTTTVVDAAE